MSLSRAGYRGVFTAFSVSCFQVTFFCTHLATMAGSILISYQSLYLCSFYPTLLMASVYTASRIKYHEVWALFIRQSFTSLKKRSRTPCIKKEVIGFTSIEEQNVRGVDAGDVCRAIGNSKAQAFNILSIISSFMFFLYVVSWCYVSQLALRLCRSFTQCRKQVRCVLPTIIPTYMC